MCCPPVEAFPRRLFVELLYPVNPKQLASYRDSYPGGGKNDPTDAMYLARMLRERITTLKAWQPDDENTRLIANLSQQRRKIVDGQTKLRQQLTALIRDSPDSSAGNRSRHDSIIHCNRCAPPPCLARGDFFGFVSSLAGENRIKDHAWASNPHFGAQLLLKS